MDLNLHQIRSRPRPSPHQLLYGKYASQMVPGERFHSEMIDRAAYVYIVGCFPSHLRRTYTDALREMTRYFKKPASLDGRTGHIYLRRDIVEDLQLEQHPMVMAVRRRLSQGYLIQPSRGFASRRNYWKIFMFQTSPAAPGIPVAQITIKHDGSEKQGW